MKAMEAKLNNTAQRIKDGWRSVGALGGAKRITLPDAGVAWAFDTACFMKEISLRTFGTLSSSLFLQRKFVLQAPVRLLHVATIRCLTDFMRMEFSY